MSEKEKMITGEFYDSQDPELVAGRARARRLTEELNRLPMAEREKRQAIFHELLGGHGESFFLENRFQCDYG